VKAAKERFSRVAVTAVASLACGATVALAAGKLGPVAVRVPTNLSIKQKVTIAFPPKGRPGHGGYYYAVAVLVDYPRPVEAPHAPPCAVSSDMGVTQYGFPGRGRDVRLTLIAAASAEKAWCAGGVYLGAVYAVPHKPRCSSTHPCYGRGAGYSPCWKVGEHVVCGVVVQRPYSYPGGLPKPVDRSTSIVGHFTLRFPAAARASQRSPAAAGT
jgi:hypothetical protein